VVQRQSHPGAQENDSIAPTEIRADAREEIGNEKGLADENLRTVEAYPLTPGLFRND
jgi:hypothetical protein